MPRKKKKLGVILKIRFDEEYHTYGRVVSDDSDFGFLDIAVYDCRTREDLVDMNEIVSMKILFVVSTHPKRRWVEIGNVPLTPGEIQIPERYWQDTDKPENCIIFDADGNKRRATPDECVGLDGIEGWLPEHLEGRLRDHYAGRRNSGLEHEKVIRPGQYAGMQQFTRGDIIKIPIDEDYHTYARILGPHEEHVSSDRLSNVGAAVYDCRTREDLGDMNKIITKSVLFTVLIYGETVLDAKWTKVGNIPMAKDESLATGDKFIQWDYFTPEECVICSTERHATIDECEGLERAATWEAGEVEERISDHYAGRKNRMLEYWRLRHSSKEKSSKIAPKPKKKRKTRKKKRKRRPTKSLNKYDYEDLKKFFVCMLEVDFVGGDKPTVSILESMEEESLSMAKKSVIIGIQERIAVYKDMDKEDIERYDSYLRERGALTFSELGKSVQDQIADIFERGKIETENEYHMVMELLNNVADETFTDEDREEANKLISKFENEL